MNHALWARVAARVIAIAFVVGGAAACDRKASETRGAAAPQPSGAVVGTPPGPPQGDTAQTTSSAKSQNELSKTEESSKMPLEGQHNSFMTESKKDSQRAGGVDAQTMRRGTDAPVQPGGAK